MIFMLFNGNTCKLLLYFIEFSEILFLMSEKPSWKRNYCLCQRYFFMHLYPDATTEVPGCEHGHCVFLWDRKQQGMESKRRQEE